MLDLGDQADMTGALRIRVQQVMQSWRSRKSDGAQPKGQHQASRSDRAETMGRPGDSPARHREAFRAHHAVRQDESDRIRNSVKGMKAPTGCGTQRFR
jgi:hypothetical protein